MSETAPNEPQRHMSRQQFAELVEGISGVQIIDGAGNHAAVEVKVGEQAVIIDWGFLPEDSQEHNGDTK